jgi:hypothetical protein
MGRAKSDHGRGRGGSGRGRGSEVTRCNLTGYGSGTPAATRGQYTARSTGGFRRGRGSRVLIGGKASPSYSVPLTKKEKIQQRITVNYHLKRAKELYDEKQEQLQVRILKGKL